MTRACKLQEVWASTRKAKIEPCKRSWFAALHLGVTSACTQQATAKRRGVKIVLQSFHKLEMCCKSSLISNISVCFTTAAHNGYGENDSKTRDCFFLSTLNRTPFYCVVTVANNFLISANAWRTRNFGMALLVLEAGHRER